MKGGADPKARMQFSKDPLGESILDLPSSMNKEAKESFLSILKGMGDYPNKAGDKVIQDLVQMGIDNNGIRDEIYCQLIKQTTNNPKKESNLRGWEILVYICGSFSPSGELIPTLYSHIESGLTSGDSDIVKYATMCQERNKEVCEKGSRMYAPSTDEIKFVRVSYFCY
jgi:hypothetical protein